ncbi:flavin reductase [Rhizobium sp. KVB221]|uniref:Flavin reductase n=1 Tax=Rhizobium setariae TaxID=2801340 RepID=A0A936YJQ9_9HYPH|nr:LysR substrate-binding domain-containing protein [Rhizobium setariae]MBL0371458.1 flavin reductase [Rhizobium setariae]
MIMQPIQTELRQLFVEGMSRVASAVTVVTTDGEAGRHGVTVSSMTSVSADTTKPSLLISVHHLSPACEAIRKNGRFCANVLSGSQSGLSDLFSGRLKPESGDRFAETAWHAGATGAPVIEGAIVSFDCALRTALVWGTHCIFIGEAENIEMSEQRSPLVYANRGYRRAVPIATPEQAVPVVEEELRVGFFMTLAPQFLPSLIAEFSSLHPTTGIRLLETDHEDLVEQLRAGRIDAAISYRLAMPADLSIETLRRAQPHVLLPTDHLLAASAGLGVADLADLPMVLLDYPSVRTAINALFQRHGHKPAIRFQSPSFEMVRALVAHGLGYSIAPHLPSDLASPDGKQLVAIPLMETFAEADIVVLLRPGTKLASTMDAFLSQCRKLIE